jgi:peroxiredoxin
MRFIPLILVVVYFSASVQAEEQAEGPTSEKAQKAYKDGLNYLRERRPNAALDEFKKADKQDGGHCSACQKQMIKYGVQLGEWKTAELGATEMVADAREPQALALAHYQFAQVLMEEGVEKHKDEIFSRVHDEASKALAAFANFPEAFFLDGRALAHLKLDDQAKARFEQYAKLKPEEDLNRQRALRYISRPELARARMAPTFTVTTKDGKRISMDDLQGKVVLIDFWATWCAPCREALPHIQKVAKKFQGQPLVILSVSLDSDEQKWSEFITKYEMTWPQYRDGGFAGPVAKKFGVAAIPHTFTIDTDGVLQEEHIGDASVEGKLKKLLAHARELPSTEKPAN